MTKKINSNFSTPWLTLEEAAAFLKTSPSSLYKMVVKGEVPAYRLGRQWRLHREILEKWLLEKSNDNSKTKL